jgi:hypothetical protein
MTPQQTGAYAEYVVMRCDYPQAPHRRPFRRTDGGDDLFDLSPAEQREWCEAWVKEGEDDGMRRGAFYVARRIVTRWEPADANCDYSPGGVVDK